MANILIVDDERDILEQLPEIVQRWGHQTFTASNGFEALKVFEQHNIDLVVSDIKMPEMNGYELLQKVQEIDKQCVVLFLTGYPSLDSAVDAMQSGAEDYLIKPVNFDELKLKIDRSLARTAKIKSVPILRGLNWILIILIPFWLILGIIVAKLLR